MGTEIKGKWSKVNNTIKSNAGHLQREDRYEGGKERFGTKGLCTFDKNIVEK